MRTYKIWGLALLGLFLASFSIPVAGAQQAAAAKEPDPSAVIKQMCDYLKSLKEFSYHAEVADDRVYHDGKKLQYGIEMDTYVKRPDKLRVNAVGDLLDKQFFFNGKAITLYDRDEKVYATMEVPPSIEDALDKAHRDYGLRVALIDLADPKLWDLVSGKTEHSLYVGMHNVRGVPCHHVALDGENVHLQLWIDAGKKPLLRKVVFTQKKLEGSPQWTAYLSDWKTDPRLGDTLFNFAVPAGVQKIKFVPAQPSSVPGQGKGDKS